MKKSLLMAIFLLAFVVVNAQELIIYPYEKEYIPAEIIMKDGSVKYGYIQDIELPHTFEFRGFGYDFKSIESKTYMDRKDFKYKATMDGKAELMSLDEIKAFLLKGEETVYYEKIKLKTINHKTEVIDLEREVMVPLIKEGNINIYGLRAYHCEGNNCQMMFVIAYVKHKDQDYAFIPIDYNRINFFNLGSLDDKFMESFAQVGKDCPEFLEYLTTVKSQFQDKKVRKEYKEQYKAFQKEKKEKLKDIKGAREKRRAEEDMDTEYFIKMYTDITDEYDARCGTN